MANSPQARKRVRQTERRTAVNRAQTSRVRSFVRKVETAIEAGDQSVAQEAFKLAQPVIARGVTKGVLQKRTASRKISRLSKRIKSMAS